MIISFIFRKYRYTQEKFVGPRECGQDREPPREHVQGGHKGPFK